MSLKRGADAAGALFLGILAKVDVRGSVFDGDLATVADSAYVGFGAQLRLDATCQRGGANCYTVRPPVLHGAGQRALACRGWCLSPLSSATVLCYIYLLSVSVYG